MAGQCRDWAKTINSASFKGVPFEVTSDSQKGGRRIVTHEYPSRDDWDNEDLGRAKNLIEVSGFVYGDLADQTADRLLAACNSPGPGMLVLPTMPGRMAACLTCDREFGDQEKGLLRFRMTFVLQSTARGGLFAFTYLFGAVVAAATGAIAAVSRSFSASYNAMNVPNVAREAASETVELAAATMASVVATLPMDAKQKPAIDHALATLGDQAYDLAFSGQGQDKLTPTIFAVTGLPPADTLTPRLSGVVVAICEAAADRGALADALATLIDFEAQPIHNPVNTASVKAEKDLTQKVARLVRVLALIKWAEARSLTRHATRDDYYRARAEIADRLAEEMDAAADDVEYDALDAMRQAAIEYISKTGVEGAALRRLTLLTRHPVLAIAHELYGVSGRDDDIITRNAVQHPLHAPLDIDAALP